jgi:hypothetical protein
MNFFFKRVIYHLCAKFGVFPVLATDAGDVALFLKKLYPRQCDKGLIRMGPTGDGGYLVPDDLEGIVACFSPGVDKVSGFEVDCADRGIEVHMADASVEGPPVEHVLFSFTKKFIGSTNNQTYMTLDQWVSESKVPEGSDLMLQMDIEGFEYETIFSATDDLMSRFRIIVAEFHHLNQLWDLRYFKLVSRAIDKILETHVCVHSHPNNYLEPLRLAGLTIPPLMEFTFVRKDRIAGREYSNEFPHKLDHDNSTKQSLALPKCMYKS